MVLRQTSPKTEIVYDNMHVEKDRAKISANYEHVFETNVCSFRPNLQRKLRYDWDLQVDNPKVL